MVWTITLKNKREWGVNPIYKENKSQSLPAMIVIFWEYIHRGCLWHVYTSRYSFCQRYYRNSMINLQVFRSLLRLIFRPSACIFQLFNKYWSIFQNLRGGLRFSGPGISKRPCRPKKKAFRGSKKRLSKFSLNRHTTSDSTH